MTFIPGNTSPPSFKTNYIYIHNCQELKQEIIPYLKAPIIGVDCETTGLDPLTQKIRLLQLAIPDYPVLIIDQNALQEGKNYIQQLFQNLSLKIGHNLLFELQFLTQFGFKLSPPFFDTMLAYQVFTAGLKKKCSLSSIVFSLLKIKLDKALQTSNWNRKNLSTEQLQYAASDAAIVLPLYQTLALLLEKANLISTAQDEFNCLPYVAQMELNGLKLDLQQWTSLQIELETEQNQLEQIIEQHLNFKKQPIQLSLLEEYPPQTTNSINLRSPQQVITALKTIGIEVNSTNVKELIPLAQEHTIIRNLLDYRSLSTLISTFIYRLPKYIHPQTGRVHGNWFQLGTKSGRFSCHQANLTNIPKDKRFRRCFRAAEGNVLIKADYSQIELRLMAKASGDRRMKSAYIAGEDLHRETAAQLFKKPMAQITVQERYLGKIVNFGFIYGMGIHQFIISTAKKHNIYLSPAEASLFRKTFFKTYTGITAYHVQQRKRWQQKTRISRTLDGRRRIWAKSKPPTLNELLNNPIQGTNAGILKRAIALLGKELLEKHPSVLLIAVIHDEIVLECPRALAQSAAKILKRCMIAAAKPILKPIPVKVDVKISKCWS